MSLQLCGQCQCGVGGLGAWGLGAGCLGAGCLGAGGWVLGLVLGWGAGAGSHPATPAAPCGSSRSAGASEQVTDFSKSQAELEPEEIPKDT